MKELKEIFELLDELEEDLFSELEEENNPEVRILHYEVENILSEWDEILEEEAVRISKEYGYKELGEGFWQSQDLVLMYLILDIYNSKDKEPE